PRGLAPASKARRSPQRRPRDVELPPKFPQRAGDSSTGRAVRRSCKHPFPLQMARKDMFTTDAFTPGSAGDGVVESAGMATLAAVPDSAPVPPQNLEAEESVLGAMMLSPGAIGAVSEILDAKDFYRESHAKIYRAALALYAKGEPVDAITLTDELQERSELEDVGGRVRLHELAALVPATANASHYARIVRETATL